VPPIFFWTVMPMIEQSVFVHHRLTCTQMQSIIYVAKPEQTHRVRVNDFWTSFFGPFVSRNPWWFEDLVQSTTGLSVHATPHVPPITASCSTPPYSSSSSLSKTRTALSSLHLYKGERELHLQLRPPNTAYYYAYKLVAFFIDLFEIPRSLSLSLCVHSCVPYSRRPTLSSACRRRRRQTALVALRAGEA
jgi:hypothetical protein